MNFPGDFIEHLEKCTGFNKEEFIKAHEKPSVVSLRLNTNKKFNHQHKQQVPWAENGYYLEQRPQFVFDPLFHAGAYYVQEASGMFIEYLLKNITDLVKPLKILDLCAAPGGKSTIITSLISDNSLLVSNEVIKSRVTVLKENLIKWGNNNVVITNNDPSDFSSLINYFDIILVDAPCSGSGLFRKDISAMKEWSEENVAHCEKRQVRILDDIIPCLKSDGILIYTTCSYSSEENEEVIKKMISDGAVVAVEISVPENFGIVSTDQGFRFYPDKLEGEGFFASVLRKKTGLEIAVDNKPAKKTVVREIINEDEKIVLSKWINNSENYEFIKHHENIFAINKEHVSAIKQLESSLYIKHFGTEIGKIIRNELIPSHEVAMSNLLKTEIPAIELNKEDAIKYLKKEDLQLQATGLGWSLITFEKINLGWIKILQNRINNYYPVEWRIRK